MTEPVHVYVLKRQERMGRIKTRQLRSVQQVMDELEKLGIDHKAARSRLLDLNGVESFRSPYYGLVTVEYPVEWVMPARMRENTMKRRNPSVPVGHTYRDYWVVRTFPRGGVLVMKPLKRGDEPEYMRVDASELDDFHAAIDGMADFRSNPRPPAGSDFVRAAINNVKAKTGTFLHLVRPAGSYVEGQTRSKTDAQAATQVAEFLKSLRWEDVTDETRKKGMGFGAVRYYRATVPANAKAYEAAMLWDELSPAERARVKVVKAFHQTPGAPERFELVSDIPPKRTRLLHLMVGDLKNAAKAPNKRTSFVYTWYPGRMTPQVTSDLSAFPEGVHPMATVKAAEVKSNPRYSAEPTFTIWKDGTPYSRRPVDYEAMSDYLVFDAGFGVKGQKMLNELVSGHRQSIAFKLRGQNFAVTLAGKGPDGSGGMSGAPARLNPKRNFFGGKKAQTAWTIVRKDARGNAVQHGEASGEDLVDVIKSVGGLGHFDAVALASYARSGDRPTMKTRDEKGTVSVFPIPRSNPFDFFGLLKPQKPPATQYRGYGYGGSPTLRRLDRWKITRTSPSGEVVEVAYSKGFTDLSGYLLYDYGLDYEYARFIEDLAERAGLGWADLPTHTGPEVTHTIEKGKFKGHTITLTPIQRDTVMRDRDGFATPRVPKKNPQRNSRLPAIGETFGNYIVVGYVGKDRVKVLDWVAEKKGDGPSYYVMDAASFEGR